MYGLPDDVEPPESTIVETSGVELKHRYQTSASGGDEYTLSIGGWSYARVGIQPHGKAAMKGIIDGLIGELYRVREALANYSEDGY